MAYMADEEKKRTIRVNVRLNPETMAKLEVVSNDLGVPASTVGAVAIGEYINRKFAEKQIHASASNAAAETVRLMSDRVLDFLQDPETIAKVVASFEGADKRLEKD